MRRVVVIPDVGVFLDHFADEVQMLSVAPASDARQFLSWNKSFSVYDLSSGGTQTPRRRDVVFSISLSLSLVPRDEPIGLSCGGGSGSGYRQVMDL